MLRTGQLIFIACVLLAPSASEAVRAQAPARCDEDQPPNVLPGVALASAWPHNDPATAALPCPMIPDTQVPEMPSVPPLDVLDPAAHDERSLAEAPQILAENANRVIWASQESQRRIEGLPEEGGRWKLKNQTEGLLGSLTSQVVCGDSEIVWEQPIVEDDWQTEEAWKLDVLGPFSVFGQVGAGHELSRSEDLKLTGRTGLAWKLPVGPAGEVLLRGGPSVSCADALRPTLAQGHSALLLELQCRWPLLGPLGLEYQGSATPALSPTDHDRLNQDVRLALPLGKLGRLRVGAKHSWENLTVPRPWSDTMQLYLNFSVGQ
jgi:hypothetical protein